MKLQTLVVKTLQKTNTIVKFEFEVNAMLEAAEEASADWMLNGWIVSVGYLRKYNRLMPSVKKIPIFIDPPKSPPQSAGVGDGWKPSKWVEEVQRAQLRIGGSIVPESLRFDLRLIPKIDVNPSNTINVYIREDV